MDEAEKPVTVKAARKAMQWAERLLADLGG